MNNFIQAFFWAYASISNVSGILAPFGGSSEEIKLTIEPGVGWAFMGVFIGFAVFEVLLIRPAYDKLCWNTYQQIGSDNFIQKCYRNFEVAKGAWMLMFWFSGVECSTIFFFENNTRRIIIFGVVCAIYVTAIIFGFLAVRKPIYSLLSSLDWLWLFESCLCSLPARLLFSYFSDNFGS